VRHFSAPKIKDYNRITVGAREQMDILLDKISEILKEKK
jgi:histidinol-phosphate aminotransferase